jgi:pyruvate/2-oxoacid:ferredoxin oxidoreductase beta subunit/Pyruvate/2-oxoacid:ferredoxin oxidoreductase gamma subunit
MDSLLNSKRPPVFCQGCAHEQVVRALDQALQRMGLTGDQVVIVSDIGCSGLFDTFFNTHAFHGLHGRALTYATGIKLARPEVHVIVTMGDGGLGIGGAHVLSTCRRNIDLTLLVLNNFNYGMTGGQCSATTPTEARVGSGFLNRIEKPIDICEVAGTAGAGHLTRISTYDGEMVARMTAAIEFKGFSLMDIWGVCPGRYARGNKLSPSGIRSALERLPSLEHFQERNARREYGEHYRAEAARLAPVPPPMRIESLHRPPTEDRREVVLLGSAGQRVVTAGELLCLAGAAAGLQATQKNDYPITVLRGHSVSEVVLSREAIGFTGIDQPHVVIALAAEGIARRGRMLAGLPAEALVLKANGVALPDTAATVLAFDFKDWGIKSQDWALAALGVLARRREVLDLEMLRSALDLRFEGRVREAALAVVEKTVA